MNKESLTTEEDKQLRERCFENACKSSSPFPLDEAIAAYEFINDFTLGSIEKKFKKPVLDNSPAPEI